MESDIIFLPMTQDDIDQIVAIEEDSFSMPWSKTSFEDMLKRDDAIYLVGKRKDEVLSYCGACIVCDEAYINQVAVKRENRNENIGTAMMLSFLKMLIAKDVRAVTLEVRVSNMAAIRMYEKCGFKTEGVRKDFYEKPDEDALILWNTSFNQ